MPPFFWLVEHDAAAVLLQLLEQNPPIFAQVPAVAFFQPAPAADIPLAITRENRDSMDPESPEARKPRA